MAGNSAQVFDQTGLPAVVQQVHAVVGGDLGQQLSPERRLVANRVRHKMHCCKPREILYITRASMLNSLDGQPRDRSHIPVVLLVRPRYAAHAAKAPSGHG